MESRVVFELEQGDITTIGADVVAVKYAQKFHGADGVIADNLGGKGVPYSSIQSAVGSHRFLASQGAITANQVLFVGVLPLFQFGYQEIRAFGRSVLRILQQEAPRCKHLAMTIHGPGYGMDETEACFAQLQGYLDAFKAGQAPDALERISIVDRNSNRILRLRRALEVTSISVPLEYVSEGCWLFPPMGGNPSATSSAMPAPPLVSAEAGGPPKPHIFVAMPFSTHMDDVFYFGIQQPVHAAGFLCERMDHVSFAGGIVDWIKRKIETAKCSYC